MMRGEGAMVLSPVPIFFFAFNQKQTFFSSQAKERANPPPPCNPIFPQVL